MFFFLSEGSPWLIAYFDIIQKVQSSHTWTDLAVIWQLLSLCDNPTLAPVGEGTSKRDFPVVFTPSFWHSPPWGPSKVETVSCSWQHYPSRLYLIHFGAHFYIWSPQQLIPQFRFYTSWKKCWNNCSCCTLKGTHILDSMDFSRKKQSGESPNIPSNQNHLQQHPVRYSTKTRVNRRQPVLELHETIIALNKKQPGSIIWKSKNKAALQKYYMNRDKIFSLSSEKGYIWEALLRGSTRDWSRRAAWIPAQMLPNKTRGEKAIYAGWGLVWIAKQFCLL